MANFTTLLIVLVSQNPLVVMNVSIADTRLVYSNFEAYSEYVLFYFRVIVPESWLIFFFDVSFKESFGQFF